MNKVRSFFPTGSFLLVLLLLAACQPAIEGTPTPSQDSDRELSNAQTAQSTDTPSSNSNDEDRSEDETSIAPTEDIRESSGDEADEAMEEGAAETAGGDAILAEPTEERDIKTGPISDEEARELMDQLSGRDPDLIQEAMVRIVSQSDQRFISVLIELYRGNQIGLVIVPADLIVFNLQLLSGQEFGLEWDDWIEWYGGTDLEPPPGFTTWKGEMLSRIDPGFGEFLQDDFPSDIRVEEIQWGGVRVDGIPALDQAEMVPADDPITTYLSPEDAVFGLSINGDSRAYPLKILDWHEMANDVVGGVPVSIAYCTLCGAAVAYDGRASDGETYDFGSSGFLFRSNKLMYDRQTRTLWNQLTGKPVLGTLVETDVRLDLLPIVLTTWDDWRTLHPETQVLHVDTGFARNYETGAAYGDYFSSEFTMFPVWQRDEQLATKDQVFALSVDDQPKAYPLEILTEVGVVNDEHAGLSLVLVAGDSQIEIDGVSRRAGSVTYSPGATVRVFESDGKRFEASETPQVLLDEAGQRWEITEDGLVSEAGEMLPRYPGHLAYWFGWYAFFPETAVYELN